MDISQVESDSNYESNVLQYNFKTINKTLPITRKTDNIRIC